MPAAANQSQFEPALGCSQLEPGIRLQPANHNLSPAFGCSQPITIRARHSAAANQSQFEPSVRLQPTNHNLGSGIRLQPTYHNLGPAFGCSQQVTIWSGVRLQPANRNSAIRLQSANHTFRRQVLFRDCAWLSQATGTWLQPNPFLRTAVGSLDSLYIVILLRLAFAAQSASGLRWVFPQHPTGIQEPIAILLQHLAAASDSIIQTNIRKRDERITSKNTFFLKCDWFSRK